MMNWNHLYNRRIIFKVTLIFLLLVLTSGVVLLVVRDKFRLNNIRNLAKQLSLRSTQADAIKILGQPDCVSTGAMVDSTGKASKRHTIMLYCSHFDWVGFRSKSETSSILTYWYSRLNPLINERTDFIVELWYLDDQLTLVKFGNAKDRLGENSAFSY